MEITMHCDTAKHTSCNTTSFCSSHTPLTIHAVQASCLRLKVGSTSAENQTITNSKHALQAYCLSLNVGSTSAENQKTTNSKHA